MGGHPRQSVRNPGEQRFDGPGAAEPIGRSRPAPSYRHTDRLSPERPKCLLISFVVAQVDGERRLLAKGFGQEVADCQRRLSLSPRDPRSELEHLLAGEDLQAGRAPAHVADDEPEREDGCRVGAPEVKADGQAFPFHKNPAEPIGLLPELSGNVTEKAHRCHGAGMSKTYSPPGDLEAMASCVGGAGDADEPPEVFETPAREDPDAYSRVAGKASEKAAGFRRQANGFGAIPDRRERAVKV